MLNFLQAGNHKQILGLAITPGVGLEAVVLDGSRQFVLNYGRKKVEYNFSSREIANYGHFKQELADLISEMKIPPKTPAYLVLPNVLFDFIELNSDLPELEIKGAITSKAEEFYLFKKEDPVSGLCEVANIGGNQDKKYAYTAFQKTAVDSIKDAVNEIGLQLVGIESNYSATLRGLYLAHMLDDVILEDAPWAAMLINSNSYILFRMEGKNLLEFNEVPLAIRSFSTEEAYQAIESSASQFLSNYSSSKLFIISQTEEICADTLKKQMQFDREIVAIDSNKFAQNAPMEVQSALDFNHAKSMTVGAIGAACFKTDFNLTLNVLADDPAAALGVYFTFNLSGTPIEVDAAIVRTLCLGITGFLAVVFIIIFILASVFENSLQTRLGEARNNKQTLETQINAESKVEKKEEIDMTVIIDDVAAGNVSAINFYDSIASDIPKNIWLTQYYNVNGDKILVRGIAENIVDIYEYYKNLRVASPQSDIKLTELKVVTQNAGTDKYISSLVLDKDTDRLYSFEISNTNLPVQKENGSKEAFNPIDESNILGSSPTKNLEETSEQMVPAD